MSGGVEERLARLDSGYYSREDVAALMRMMRAMERLAQEGTLETSVRGRVHKLITPEDILTTMNEALK